MAPTLPKLESEDASIPTRIPRIPKSLTLIPRPQIPSPLQTLSPNLADERRRLRRFIACVSGDHPNPNPNPNPSPSPSSSSALAITPALSNANKRRKPTPRSSDLRRVAFVDPGDALLIRDAVRRTRILYESIRTRLLQEEESSPLPAGRRSRADLNAATMMKNAGLWLNQENRTVGFIPGIHIGDIFFYRIELCVVGLHGQVQAGIDFIPASQSSNGEPIATSIIVSGGYEDDEDQGGVLVYTGHGGREGKNETRHSLDQRLEGGNLALERSHFYGIEIRVIRGLSCEKSPTKRVYVYDGLYKVVESWSEMGKSGFRVYKFRLVRLEGQEELGSSVIKMAEESNRVEWCLSADISKGKEKLPVVIFNDIDENRYPLAFDYLVRPTFKSFTMKDFGGSGCQCELDCSVGCECIEKNGGELPYDQDGRLLRGRPVVYECGKNCGCPKTCMNRVSQQGLRHRLEVFKSRQTDWGVRSLDFILAGEFVCEYSGILLTKQETEIASRNDACLVYPDRFPRRWEEWGDLSLVNPDYERPNLDTVHDVGYNAIDVSKARNVACYLSHSCNPNVFVQSVFFNQFNVEYRRMMVFALENIPPMRELSLDYGVGDQ